MKLFQNLTSGLREKDILKISSCLYSERTHHSLQPCLMTDQNFPNTFWERSLYEHFCENISKIWQAVSEKNIFLRISSCARSPHSPEPCLWTYQHFANTFLKGVTQGTFLWHYFKIGPAVPEKILKAEFHLVTMATRVFDGIKFCKHFLRGPPKEYSCQVWSRFARRFGRWRCLKKLLTTHDGHQAILKTPLQHVVLRWANKLDCHSIVFSNS